MKYSLRSLTIVVLVLPPVLAAAYLSLALAVKKDELPGAIGLVCWLFIIAGLGVHFVVRNT